MEPARTLIDRCGGVTAVANWLGLRHSSVLRWTYSRQRGGTGGLVPSKHQLRLIEVAEANGVRLVPQDFFGSKVAGSSVVEEQGDQTCVDFLD